MTTVPYYIQDKTINIKRKKQQRRKVKKKSYFFTYLYLFSFVFLGALWGVSHLIKQYSPEVDVSIGNNSEFTLNDSDVDMEVKTIDERLKWIQMEDELPTVSLRSKEKPTIREKQQNENKIITPPKPDKKEIKKLPEFSELKVKEIIPLPKHVITRVYMGNFNTIEEAEAIREKISAIEPELNPFIKNVNGRYTVQLGSFSDGNRAGMLVQKLRDKGYYPKVTYQN